MEYVEVYIAKPLYGTKVYIRDKYVDQAIRERKQLKITIPEGSGVVDPAEWKRNGDVLLKEFKIPGHPLKLYGGHVPLPDKKGTIVEKSKQGKLI